MKDEIKSSLETAGKYGEIDHLSKIPTGLPKILDVFPEGGFKAGQMTAIFSRPVDDHRRKTLISSHLAVLAFRQHFKRPMFLSLEDEETNRLMDAVLMINEPLKISEETRQRLMSMNAELLHFTQNMESVKERILAASRQRAANSQVVFDSLKLWLDNFQETTPSEYAEMEKSRKNRVKRERFNPNAKDRLKQSQSAKANVRQNPFWSKSKGS